MTEMPLPLRYYPLVLFIAICSRLTRKLRADRRPAAEHRRGRASLRPPAMALQHPRARATAALGDLARRSWRSGNPASRRRGHGAARDVGAGVAASGRAAAVLGRGCRGAWRRGRGAGRGAAVRARPHRALAGGREGSPAPCARRPPPRSAATARARSRRALAGRREGSSAPRACS